MSEKPYISVVIPVYNEECNLQPLFARLFPVLEQTGKPFEIIFTDDGSCDRSLTILKEFASGSPEVKVIEFNGNFGQHMAILAAFEKSAGEIVITLDADLQNPPEEIPKLVAEMEKGHDVVGSIRQKRRDTLFRRIASRLVNVVTRKMTGMRMSDYGCMLRAYHRNIIDSINRCQETTTFIPALAQTFATNPVEVEVAHAERSDEIVLLWRARDAPKRLAGVPLDSKGEYRGERAVWVDGSGPQPLDRVPIREALGCGIRALDAFVTCGRGQRIGIFGGSGVGKSTLLGMMARGTSADMTVLALVGERGREVGEFLEVIGDEGRKRCVVVVSTSDQSPLLRLRCALSATAIAEYFASTGKNVLLVVDSLTRFAMAQREIGLSAGEPPTAKGYTPSVLNMLARLVERAGCFKEG
ncbi:MAG: glycosyltransferase, partial [Geobacteraceae bacterium]